jgi:hypothetical protein
MSRITQWLKKVLEDTLTRTISGVIVGIVLTLGLGAVAYRLSAFLQQPVTTSVLIILILSLFALVGVFAPVTRIWELVSASRRASARPGQSDQALQAAAANLRRLLATVEAGPDLRYEQEVKKFTAEMLTAFDDWEMALQQYLSAAQLVEVHALRTEIAGRSLLHSRQEARAWLSKVKELTSAAAVRKPS